MNGSREALEAARFLVSTEGVEFARRVDNDADDDVRVLRRLRKKLDAARAAGLVSQRRGRRALAHRHQSAASLFLTADAVSQASSQRAAAWRARRFERRGLIADLTASVGLDALELAKQAPVVAMDSDPVRLTLARANLAHATHPTLCVVGRSPEALPNVRAAFCDPDRRREGRRLKDPNEASPPLNALLEVVASRRLDALCVKLSPMADLAPLRSAGEVELISMGRELKEVVLWAGDFRQAGEEAVVRVSRPDADFTWAAQPMAAPPVRAIGDWIGDPDPALIRSGLLGTVAHELAFGMIESTIAYTTGDRRPEHPLILPRRVLGVLRGKPKEVENFLRERGIGRVTATRRGHPIAPVDFLSRLRLDGGGDAAHLLLTRTTERRVVIVTVSDPG